MKKEWNGSRMRIVTVNLPEKDLRYIHKLLGSEVAPSRSEYVRRAVRNQIERDAMTQKYLKAIEEGERELDPKLFVRVPGYNGNKPIKIIRRLESPEEKKVYY